MKFLLLTATAASALDYLSSLKTPTAPSVRAPPAPPASVPATREELVAQWRAACDVEVTSYADFGLRVAPVKAPLEAVVAAPAKAVSTPTLPKLKLPDTPTLPKVDVQLPKEGKEVALAAFALATGAAASALKAAAAGPRERERAASYSGSGDKLEALVAGSAVAACAAAVCGCGGALSLLFGGVVLAHGLLDAAADGAVLARWAGRRAITAGGDMFASAKAGGWEFDAECPEGVGLGPRGLGRGRRRDEGRPGAGPKGRPGDAGPRGGRRGGRRAICGPRRRRGPLLRARDQGEKTARARGPRRLRRRSCPRRRAGTRRRRAQRAQSRLYGQPGRRRPHARLRDR